MVKEALASKSHRCVTAGSENSPKPGWCGEQTTNPLPGGKVGPLALAARGRAHARGSRYQPLTFPCWDKATATALQVSSGDGKWWDGHKTTVWVFFLLLPALS